MMVLYSHPQRSIKTLASYYIVDIESVDRIEFGVIAGYISLGSRGIVKVKTKVTRLLEKQTGFKLLPDEYSCQIDKPLDFPLTCHHRAISHLRRRLAGPSSTQRLGSGKFADISCPGCRYGAEAVEFMNVPRGQNCFGGG